MLMHPTEQRLVAFGLAGMAKALEEQQRQPDVASLTFEERLGLLVDREAIERENKRLVSRLKFAGLRQNAVVEDIDMKARPRQTAARQARGRRLISQHQNLIIVGKRGLGKSWLACALAHKACRDDRSVLYYRAPRLFDALTLARGDGRHACLLKSIARTQLLILDDWGLANNPGEQAMPDKAGRHRVENAAQGEAAGRRDMDDRLFVIGRAPLGEPLRFARSTSMRLRLCAFRRPTMRTPRNAGQTERIRASWMGGPRSPKQVFRKIPPTHFHASAMTSFGSAQRDSDVACSAPPREAERTRGDYSPKPFIEMSTNLGEPAAT
jgi:hypothetical protein